MFEPWMFDELKNLIEILIDEMRRSNDQLSEIKDMLNEVKETVNEIAEKE